MAGRTVYGNDAADIELDKMNAPLGLIDDEDDPDGSWDEEEFDEDWDDDFGDDEIGDFDEDFDEEFDEDFDEDSDDDEQ